MLNDLEGAAVVEALDRASRGVPVFGTVALDMTTRSNLPMTIHNGAAYLDRLPLLLCAGDIGLRFFVEWFPAEKVLSEDALITGVDGNRILGINGMPAADYLRKLGLFAGTDYDVLYVMPFVLTSPDGTRKTLACIGVTADEALVCGDTVPPDGILNLGDANNDDVLESAERITRAVREAAPADPAEDAAILIISCISRSIALVNPMSEMDLVWSRMRAVHAPYFFIYSGGELCPWYNPSGNTMVNRFYQYAIIACVLRPRRQ
jgi:hypothetical protein